MADIHSATDEIRPGKKKKEETTGRKYNVRRAAIKRAEMVLQQLSYKGIR